SIAVRRRSTIDSAVASETPAPAYVFGWLVRDPSLEPLPARHGCLQPPRSMVWAAVGDPTLTLEPATPLSTKALLSTGTRRPSASAYVWPSPTSPTTSR